VALPRLQRPQGFGVTFAEFAERRGVEVDAVAFVLEAGIPCHERAVSAYSAPGLTTTRAMGKGIASAAKDRGMKLATVSARREQSRGRRFMGRRREDRRRGHFLARIAAPTNKEQTRRAAR